MPSDFPEQVLRAVRQRVVTKLPRNTDEQRHFLGGCNAVEYRFRACADYASVLIDSICAEGDAPQTEARYQQERALFGFFVNGFSCIESLCFALFAIGAHLHPSVFPMTSARELKAITLNTAYRAYNAAFPSEALTLRLGEVRLSDELRQWTEVRHVLIHRTAPGRTIFGSMVSLPPPALWQGMTIEARSFEKRRAWLSANVRAILEAADQFTIAHF